MLPLGVVVLRLAWMSGSSSEGTMGLQDHARETGEAEGEWQLSGEDMTDARSAH